MSVESEILRIQHNIANTYAAVSEKGGEVPLQPTSASLAAAVASIPAASDIEAGSGLSKNGNILSVDLPTEAITRAEYEALTEEERQADVLLIVDEPEWFPTTISVQEYDTEDGWHVEKYSNGKVNMYYISEPIAPSFLLWTGDTYRASIKALMKLPLTLTKKFIDETSLVNYESTGGWLMPSPMTENDLEYTNPCFICAPANIPESRFKFMVHVAGQWK